MSDRLVSFDTTLGHRADGRDPLSRLAWYEGLQLLPQHFQAMDERLDGLLARQMAAVSPLSWGLDRLVVDEVALHSGRLRVIAASGQFPDGTVFSHDERQGGKLEMQVRPGDEGAGRRYAIAMPLDDFTSDGVEVHRYRQVAGEFLVDRNNRSEKAAVARCIPNLRLCDYDPDNAHLVQIPFIDVELAAGGLGAGRYHPPAVRLLRQSDCSRQIVQLIKRLRAKAAELDASPLPAALTRDHMPGLMPVFSAITAVLPRLEAQLSAGIAHPYQILLSLCDAAGMLSALAGRVPNLFPPYDHADPADSLMAVVGYIDGIARRISFDDTRWTETPFVLSDNRWVCRMAARPDEDLILRLCFRASDLDAPIKSWVSHALVCWDVQESECHRLRIRGLRRSLEAAPLQSGLSVTAGQRFLTVRAGQLIGQELVISAPEPHAQVAITAVHLLSPPVPAAASRSRSLEEGGA